MNMYGMTKKKIIHLIADDNRNGCNGYRYPACGKRIMPTEVTETIPENRQMCLQCQKSALTERAAPLKSWWNRCVFRGEATVDVVSN